MPKEREIAQILSGSNAKVRSSGTGNYKMGNDLLKNDLVGGIDADLCWYANSNINTVDNLIEFRAAARGTPGTDSIIVGSQPTWAVTGQLVDPPAFSFPTVSLGAYGFCSVTVMEASMERTRIDKADNTRTQCRT